MMQKVEEIEEQLKARSYYQRPMFRSFLYSKAKQTWSMFYDHTTSSRGSFGIGCFGLAAQRGTGTDLSSRFARLHNKKRSTNSLPRCQALALDVLACVKCDIVSASTPQITLSCNSIVSFFQGFSSGSSSSSARLTFVITWRFLLGNRKILPRKLTFTITYVNDRGPTQNK